MKKFNIIGVLVLLGFVISACNVKDPAVGKEDQIVVFADSTQYYNLEGTLLDVFSKIIYTPQPEKLFLLERKDISELEKFKHYKNIIILASLNSKNEVANYLKQILDKKVKELVAKDSVYVINKYDLWAKGQLVMILTSPTLEKLKKHILFGHRNLVQYFQKESNKRLSAKLYSSIYENKKAEAKLLKKFGWTIFVEVDYLFAKEDSINNFVWLRRAPNSDVERWIFVRWIDNATPAYLNRDSIIALRNRITKKYYRTTDNKSYVEIADNYLTTREVNFHNRYALMTQGLWRMSDQSMGGPFVNYTFYDAKTRRLYMIDGSLYAPKYKKKKIIQQVDIILQSFRTKGELSKERIDDLMSELD